MNTQTARYKLQVAKTLLETGMLEPTRPDKALRSLAALRRWGPTPAAAYTGAAIRYPHRLAVVDERGSLTFEEPDPDRFPALALARRAGEAGGTMPAVLNAANEAAVESFCNHKISFDKISQLVARTMDGHKLTSQPTLEQILAADTWARQHASGLCGD